MLEAKARSAVHEIEQAVPGVTAWYGEATEHWWALVWLPEGARLLEAINPRELRDAIANPSTWPYPRCKFNSDL